MSEEYGKEKDCAIAEIKEVIKIKIVQTEEEITDLIKRFEKLKIFQETDDEFEKLTTSGLLKSEDFDLVAADRVFGTLQTKIEKAKLFLVDLKNYLEKLEENY